MLTKFPFTILPGIVNRQHSGTKYALQSFPHIAYAEQFLTSAVSTLPELEKPDLTPDGSLVIDESDPDAYGVFMNFGNKTVEDIAGKDKVILEIKNGPIPDDEPKE